MKMVSKEQIQSISTKLKAAGKTIVFTNGCFDILHAGHVRYLAAARALGDVLVVGLNTDASVQALKGPTRPINHEDDRAEVMAALAAVDFVVLFGEQTADVVIEAVRPDVYAKGGDYQVEDIPEAETVKRVGGKTVLMPLVPGRSSTNIINKIKE